MSFEVLVHRTLHRSLRCSVDGTDSYSVRSDRICESWDVAVHHAELKSIPVLSGVGSRCQSFLKDLGRVGRFNRKQRPCFRAGNTN